MRFRKLPEEVEAVQWTGENPGEVGIFFGQPNSPFGRDGDSWFVQTPKGTMRAVIGDWIIKDVQGEFSPCKPDIFSATYERVLDETAGEDSGVHS